MKSEKDVLFLCQYFYPEYVSSATLPYDTALSLRNAGLSVDVICGYPKEYNLNDEVPIKEIHNGIEITRLRYIQLKRSNFIGRLINYFSFTISVMLNFMRLKKYKLIIVYSNPPILPYIASLANKFFNSKIIFVSYDIYPEIAHLTNTISKKSMISKLMRLLNRSIFKRVNKVVALSTEMKTYLLENRPSLTPGQIEIIPNWYKDKGVSISPIENNLLGPIKDKKLIVSYFGNMGIAQDIETLVNAIREMSDDKSVHFLFAGHGFKLEMLKELTNKEKLENVTIFDFLHGQDFQDALDISDCFIVSLADGLTGLAVPSKTYSYMMAGKPVIAIMGEDSDIARDLIENNAGYAMKAGQTDKLVKSIKELRDDYDNRIRMGKNCRKVYLEKYTDEICTKQYVNLVQTVLEA